MTVRSVLYSIFILCFSITLSADSIYESHHFEVMDCEDIDTTICSGEVFEFEGQTFDETGIYELTSVNCVGMFTLNLTVTHKPEDEVTIEEMCEGNSRSSHISIYNDRGQLMTTQATDQQQIQFDTSEYPIGVYVVKVQVGDEVVSRKLVVVR